MKNNNKIGQELSEFKPVELVGYEDKEAGNLHPFRGRVVHASYKITKEEIERGEDEYKALKALQLIHDLCIDYDGFNTVDGLKSLIDDIRVITEDGLIGGRNK